MVGWASSTNSPGYSHTTLQPLQAVSEQPTQVISPGLSSKPQVSAPSRHLCQRMCISGWDTQDGGPDRLGRSLTAMPQQTSCCIFLWASEAPFLSLLLTPLVEGAFQSVRNWHFSSSLSGVQVLSCFLLLFFFHPMWLCGDFSHPSRNLRSLYSVGVLWGQFHL